jgi:OOP family OmpA-OmpF porin
MMKKSCISAIAVLGLACVPAAHAADNGTGWYGLIGAGETWGNGVQSTIDSSLSGAGAVGFSSNVEQLTVYRLTVGYQASPNLAVEGGYLGSNREHYTVNGGSILVTQTTNARIDGWNLVAVGTIPLGNQFSLMGRLGVASMEARGNPGGSFFSTDLNGYKTNVTYGIGAQYTFAGGVFLRLDADNYDIGNSNYSNRTSMWTFDVGYNF